MKLITNIYYITTLLALIACIGLVTGCRTPPPPARLDSEIEREVAAARSAYNVGATEHAAAAFEKALQRARLIDDNAEITRSAYNLAVCLATLQQYETARARLDEAQQALADPNNPPAEFILLRTQIARGVGEIDSAIALAQNWLDTNTPKTARQYYCKFQVLLSELLYFKEEYDAVRVTLKKIPFNAIAKEKNQSVIADYYRLWARLALQENAHENAARFFDQAAGHFRDAKHFAAMAECLADAGRAWAGAGDLNKGAERMYRAARSLHEQNRPEDARDIAREALPLAQDQLELQTLLRNVATP